MDKLDVIYSINRYVKNIFILQVNLSNDKTIANMLLRILLQLIHPFMTFELINYH